MPSIRGIRRSISTTSGLCSAASASASSPSAAVPTSSMPVEQPEQRAEALADDALVVGEQDADHVAEATARPGSRRRSGRRSGARRAARRARACRSARSRGRSITGAASPWSCDGRAWCRRPRRSSSQLHALGRAVAAHVGQRLLGGAVEREPRLGGRLARRAGDRQRARPGSRAARSSSCGQVVAAQRGDRLARLGQPAHREVVRALEARRSPRGRRRGRAPAAACPRAAARARTASARARRAARARRGRARPARPTRRARRATRAAPRRAPRASSRRAASRRISRMIRNHGSDARTAARRSTAGFSCSISWIATSPPTVPPQIEDRGVAAEPDAADRHHEVDARVARAVGLDGGEHAASRSPTSASPMKRAPGEPLVRGGRPARGPATSAAIARITSGPSPCRLGFGSVKKVETSDRRHRDAARARAAPAAGLRSTAVARSRKFT